MGVALQAVNLTVATLVYLPFVALADKRKNMMRHTTFLNLLREYREDATCAFTSQRKGQAHSSASAALARNLAHRLKTGLQMNDPCIGLYYQPRINISNKTVPMVEALIRWNHPTYGFIPPEVMFPLAVEADALDMLEERIFSMAIMQLGEWQTRGIKTAIVVNASNRLLENKNFSKNLADRLKRLDLPPDQLILEISEHIALDPFGKYITVQQNLHAAGIRLSINNYGLRFHSLNQLRLLPISNLQINKELVRAVTYNKSCQDIVAELQEICMELNITITAGHVETREQLETLLELNISTFQGYLFTEPASAAACEDFIVNFGSR